jgi:hypothetical protein
VLPKVTKGSTGMSEISTTTSQRRPRLRRHIEIDGDTLIPRVEFAEDILGVSDKTASKMNLPTTYVGGMAYVARNASLKIVADAVRRPNQAEEPEPRPRLRRRPIAQSRSSDGGA